MRTIEVSAFIDDEIDSQYVGVTRLSREGVGHMAAARRRRVEAGTWNGRIHMTDFLRAMLDDGRQVAATTVEGGWLEVAPARTSRSKTSCAGAHARDH
jgi:hypothetical protein